MQFLFQPLTWGFLLVGVPILVHLINMLRHRKQKWAAMDFLLESYRRNRRWVMLKQWLLLASRILAMLLLVAMLAKWVSNSQWLSWFGGKTTHHYVLLDDSYSMAEVDQNTTAYTRALNALGGLVRSIAGQPGQHQITLVRFSRAALATRSSDANARVDSAADLIAQTIPQDPSRLLDRLNASNPVAMQLSPETPLELIAPSMAEKSEEQAEVYLLSDFRRNEFGEPESLRNKLQSLVQNDARIHMIDCAKDGANNATVVSLEPEQEVWAAGVPLMARFQIRNQSLQAKKNLVVKVRTIAYPENITAPQLDRPYSGVITELPPVVIEQLAPGETASRQVQVIFGLPGNHVIEVALPDDALATDNYRWCTIAIKSSQRVLLVDGDVEQSNAYYFETVINPDARLKTGMTFEKVDASYLRDVAPEQLDQFDVIAMLDVPRIDQQGVTKLEQYANNGGGILFICGANTNLNFVNTQLYRDGSGIFPAQLLNINEPARVLGDSEPQVAAGIHPILAPLNQLSSSPFFQIQIFKYLGIDPPEAEEASLEIVATGPDGEPLIVDRSFGEGRVVTLLTGLSSDWSNWAQDPTFVVLSLRSLGYLGSFRREATSAPIASPLEMIVTGETILPEASLVFPARGEGLRVRVQREVEQRENGSVARIDMKVDLAELDRDLIDGLLRPGVFEAWMMNGQGQNRNQNFAHNVAAAEGDMSRVGRGELQRKLQGVDFEWKTADAMSGIGLNAQDAAHSTLLMILLAVLLLAEQWLAYSASYHAPRNASAFAGRGSPSSARSRNSSEATAAIGSPTVRSGTNQSNNSSSRVQGASR